MEGVDVELMKMKESVKLRICDGMEGKDEETKKKKGSVEVICDGMARSGEEVKKKEGNYRCKHM